MFKQIYGTETVKPYHSVLSCAQNEDNRNSNNYVKFTKQKLTKYFSVHFTNRLTDFWATVNEYGVECPFGCFCSGNYGIFSSRSVTYKEAKQ